MIHVTKTTRRTVVKIVHRNFGKIGREGLVASGDYGLGLVCVRRPHTVIVRDCESPARTYSWKNGINTLWVPQDPSEELIRLLRRPF